MARRAAFVFLAAFTLGTACPALGAAAAHASTVTAATVTPAQEWAACTAAWQLRDHQVEHAPVPSRAWWDTWRAAGRADPAMRADIREWMRTGRAWFRVRYDCNPDEGP